MLQRLLHLGCVLGLLAATWVVGWMEAAHARAELPAAGDVVDAMSATWSTGNLRASDVDARGAGPEAHRVAGWSPAGSAAASACLLVLFALAGLRSRRRRQPARVRG